MSGPTPLRIPPLSAWILASRPKTLVASIIPVGLGFVLVEGSKFEPLLAITILFTAVLIQISCNFANDAIDYERGTDTENRLGPARMTQAGIISARAMKQATALTVLLSIISGAYLVSIGGWPILVVGLLSLFFAILYSAGPFALSYLGLGEIFVWIFFGPVAVAGTVYLFEKKLSYAAVLVGLSCGAISTAILAVNNLRDIETDKLTDKRTLAVRFGTKFARTEYALLMIIAAFIPLGISLSYENYRWAAIALLYLPAVVRPIRAVLSGVQGSVLNVVLEQTAKALVLLGVLLGIGLSI